ncbi:hypothetical protein NK6_5962 [Bradyrhizobium diazoefficiens]|uniref:Uncharacterized protein n=1 Tax=Bradyrhizobium diazoefficiens TaxID=1355477 RepID=A0A0E4BSI8_9BRAD|nr:hypothetical protein NK6_5962 [Bradyrhizobium diazoefficiens]
MGGQADVIGTVRAAHVQAPKKPTARRSDGPGSLCVADAEHRRRKLNPTYCSGRARQTS